MLLKRVMLTLVIYFGVPIAGAAEASPWLVGTWQKTMDEDESPADVMKFNEDGTWIAYGPECQEKLYEYFIHNGDVFLVIPIEKGPVSLVFRPSSDKSKLKFTSPRTMNSAIYEKVENPLCGR
jgi:hypothetical protein